jgi:hypothetical protein
MCWVQDSLHHQKCIIYHVIFPREAHYEESAANRQGDRSVPGDTAVLFCSGVPRKFVGGGGGGGCPPNSVEGGEQPEGGAAGDSPLVRGSGGSCNLSLFMTTNLLVIANIKQLRT